MNEKRHGRIILPIGGAVLSLVMIVLTVLHGYGVIGRRGIDAPNGLPSELQGGMGESGGIPSEDGELIGEAELPSGGQANGGQMSDGQTPPELPSGGMGDGPAMPSGGGFGGNGMEDPNGMGRDARNGGSLGGHLAFASVWCILLGFCLSWLILRHGKEGDRWTTEPAFGGTN